MENRRQSYRLPFNPNEALRVELRLPGEDAPLDCELIDLSLGGMRVRLRHSSHALTTGARLVTRLLGREGPEPVELSLALPSCVTHLERAGAGTSCGVAFLPIADVSVNDRVERILGRFLMAEQRRLRRRDLADEEES
jgi:c-di-GMP-binding flagellar brake protein YcgR